jgi:chemotaxis protein methyltransferase CheR
VIRFIDRVHDRMALDGFLFLGFSESLWQISERFRLLRIGDAFVYRPAGSGTPFETLEGRRSPAPSDAPAVVPRRPIPSPMPSNEPIASPDIGELLATGEAAAERGDHAAAAASFRQAAYLDPDHPLAHFHLGLALEALGDERSAQRAFRAAAAAIDGASTQAIQQRLGGFRSRDLALVLHSKLTAPSR